MRDLERTYRYIVQTAGVCGGKPRIEDSRICVHDVIGLLQNGETVDSVTRELPGLTRAQVYECLSYYEDHLAEIDYLVALQAEAVNGTVQISLPEAAGPLQRRGKRGVYAGKLPKNWDSGQAVLKARASRVRR